MKQTFNRELKKTAFNFLKPWKLYGAWRHGRQRKVLTRVEADPQLKLYSRMVRNDMLHYGYFDNPDAQGEHISMADIEQAQIRYVENIVALIKDKSKPILDIGCGTGGLSHMLMSRGFVVEALTPDKHQVTYINSKYPELTVHHCKFEDFPEHQARFGTIINSESFQYIALDSGMKKVGDLLLPGGQWIICDYFRQGDAHEKSGHQEDEFMTKAQASGWRLSSSTDITPHILPTLRYFHTFSTRVAVPIADFAFEKYRHKSPGLHYLSNNLVEYAQRAMHKNLETINPQRFAQEKKYMLMVLERS